MREGTGLAVGVVAIVTAVVVLANQVPDGVLELRDAQRASSVVISEVVASNGGVLADEDGDPSDWIELHNLGDEPAVLDGHHLTDDPDDLQRWTLPELTLGAGERMLVWASGKDRTSLERQLHTDFAIAQDGEPIVLSAPDGEVLDHLEAIEIPRNASYGRHPEEPARWCFFERPAPGGANDGRCYEDAPTNRPQLTVPGGFHLDDVDLAIDSPDDLDVYYTLDGSYPDPVDNADATSVYEAPLRITDRSDEPDVLTGIPTAVADPPHSAIIAEWEGPDEPVEKATVVRARTPFSEEVTATYLIGEEHVREELPIVSIATDPDHLFDDATGIHVPGDLYTEWAESDAYDPEAGWADIPANFHQRGREWERPPPDDPRRAAVFTFCDPDDGCVYSNHVGLRIHGGVSRTYPFKSFRLYARNAYGERTFDHPFFGDEGPTSHRRLLLRNSGNDWNVTMLLDGYVQSLASHLEVETQEYQPTVVFLNGEYWGLMNLRERYDEHYLAAVHGVDPDLVSILSKDGPQWEVAAGAPGAEQPYLDLLEFADTNDLSDPAAFAHVEQRMDLDDLLDYLMIEVFSGNLDWPGNNTDIWRLDVEPDPSVDGPEDGRWRWLTYDLDQLGNNSIDPEAGTLERITREPTVDPVNNFGIPLLLRALLDNDGFRERYLSHFADHLNTTFEPDRATAELDRLEDLLEGEMERHTQRWPGPVSMDHWRNNVGLLRSYMQLRPAEQRRQLVERFELEGTTDVHVRTSGEGTVHVNDIALAEGTPGVVDPTDWQGTYFDGIPLQLRAEPAEGHRFVGWEGLVAGSSEPETTFVPRGPATVELEAVFEPA